MTALVFLEHHLADFAGGKPEYGEKWLDILRKAWRKMSDRALAGGVRLAEPFVRLVRKAVGAS